MTTRAAALRRTARARAGAVRRPVWQALQRLDPARLTLVRPPPGLRVAVACVYRGRNAGHVRELLAGLPPGTTVRLWSLDGDVPADLAVHTIGSGPGQRFALLNRLAADVAPQCRSDAMVFVDDDIRFVVGDIGRLVATAARLSLDLYQPAHSARSHANWAFVRRRALTCARRTDFVEQGPLIGMSARAQQSLLPFPEDVGMAWGVEVRWWSAAVRDLLVQGIVDAAVVEHLTGTAQEYDRAENERRLEHELRRAGLADLSLLQRTTATTRTSSRGRAVPRGVGPPPGPSTATPADPADVVGGQVSVVVPTRHRRDSVVRLLRALGDDPAVREVIVVVDGAADTTLAALHALRPVDPRLTPVWQEHGGAGAARQNGLEHARGDIVLFLDDDVVPHDRLASGHLAAHRRAPGGLVVGVLPPVRPRARRTVHTVVDELYAEDYDVCLRDYGRDPTTVLDHLWAGNLSIDRDLALRVGVGDPVFDTLFFEDRDLGLRLRAAGATATYAPQLAAAHHHAGTLRSYLRDSERQGRALVLLHDRYPAQVPEPTARSIAGRFPAPARLLVWACQRSPWLAGRALTGALLMAGYLTGALRLWPLQRVLVVLLRRAGQAKGAGSSSLRAAAVPVSAGA